ncbi:outer envelope [Prunus dulcis]|uniref:Outer envelope n=1 Tax=Prunus dulcis TaxID=3755 RepID=A0A5E4G090_PRUDU|nr:outer envelope [Prunus dulcis]
MRGGYGTVILPGPLSAAFRSPAKQRCSGVVARKIGSLMGQVLEIDHMEGGLYWQVPASPYWGGCAAAAHRIRSREDCGGELLLDSASSPCKTRSRDSTLVEKIREAKEAEDRNRNIWEAGILGKQGARAVARSASLSVPQRVGGVFQIFAIDRVAFDMNAKAMTESVAATKGVDFAVGGQQDFLWRDLIQLHVSGTQGSYPFNLGPLIYAQGNGSHLAGINLRRKQGRSDDAFDNGDKRACNAHLWVRDIEGARVEGLRQELTFEDTSLQVEETSFIRFPQGF